MATTKNPPTTKAPTKTPPGQNQTQSGAGAKKVGGPVPPEPVKLAARFAEGKVAQGVSLAKPEEAVTGLIIHVTGLCMDRDFLDSAYFGEGKRHRDPRTNLPTRKMYVEALASIDMTKSLADMGGNPLEVTAKAVQRENGAGPQGIHLTGEVVHFIQLANAWKQSWFLEAKNVYAYEEGGHTGGAPIMSMGGG